MSAEYTTQLANHFGYSGTWIPTAEVQLGDIGRLRKHTYEHISTLELFGIDFEIRKGVTRGRLEYSSADSVKICFKAEGELPTINSALKLNDNGITVSFNSKGAVLFQATNCEVYSIVDQHNLAKKVLPFYESKKWAADYVIITEVVKSERATILVSTSKDAVIEFKTESNLKLDLFELVNPKVGLEIVKSNNICFKIIAENGLTPLFKAKGIKRKFFSRGSEFCRKKMDGIGDKHEAKDEILFTEVDYNDFNH